jgi:holin-like protein
MGQFFRQCMVIMILSLIAEVISFYLKPIIFLPAPIVGVILVAILMQANVIKQEHIANLAQSWLKNITILFVPVGVSLMGVYSLVRGHFLSFLVSMIIISVLSIGCVGFVAQIILGLFKRR